MSHFFMYPDEEDPYHFREPGKPEDPYHFREPGKPGKAVSLYSI